MNLDLGPAFDRAQTVVNGLVAAIPSTVVALVVFGGFLVVAAIVKGVVPAPDVLLMNLASSSVNLRVRWWIAPPQRADAPQEILFHDQTEDSDGDRGRQREGWPAGQAHVPASRKVVDAIARISQSRPRGVHGE